jgi:ubiquinone/menaquinone biosynthesis C-methylase UbiE
LAKPEGIPEYAATLAAYHAAFAPELRSMVESLPIPSGGRVLDLACGDGSFTQLLAGRVAEAGLVCGVDLASDYLKLAKALAASGPSSRRFAFAVGDLARLPFRPGAFDLVWCAQSFYSLPDPVGALRVLAGLVKAGGIVAVLESDTFHQVLLPWPIEVELALRRAELAAFVASADQPRKYYVGRRLRQVFEAAGLRGVRRRCWSLERAAPLDSSTRAFLEAYLHELGGRCGPHLSPDEARMVRPYLDPGSKDYLPSRGDLDFSVVEHVVWATPPDLSE